MKEEKVGGVQFTDSSKPNTDPYIIALFGEENTGKTRFPLTGPEVIGYVPLEMKSYVTIDKDAKELGKKILKPSQPMDLIVSKRKVDSLKDNVEKQKFYREHVEKVKNTMYALLEHRETRVVVMDKFTSFCVWQEYAINGLTPNYVKIDGQVRQSKAEVRQSLIDFVNSLSQFGKTVVLNCATKGDYEVVDAQGSPLRNTWDAGCFYMLGSHCNLVLELEDNKHWDLKKNGERFQWHWQMNVRRAQKNPGLEGPEGNPILKDDMISLPNLISMIDPEVDMEEWL